MEMKKTAKKIGKGLTITLIIMVVSAVGLAIAGEIGEIGDKPSYPIITETEEITISYYNQTINEPYNCWNETIEKNETCYEQILVVKNYTTTKPNGYRIEYEKETYHVKGYCCEYYANSPYKQYEGQRVISCKEIIVGICNPLIQQTSKDKTEYDEYGRIYIIEEKRIEPEKVGSYEYIEKYAIEPSKLEVKK